MEEVISFNPLYGNPQTAEQPMVSVCVPTYNHGKYIRQCLDGILVQKTTFPFEIILGEDDSPDDTRDICKEYADKYPDKIRLFLRRREDVIHVNGKPTGRFNLLAGVKATKGKYIAFCEGDDYWTDELKLQKQVDFLEANEDYSICGHFIFINNDGKVKPRKLNYVKETGEHLLIHNFVPLLSAVYRKSAMPGEFPDFFFKCVMGDLPMHYMVSRKGKIKMLEDYMGARRLHVGGTWSQVQKNKQLENYRLSLAKFSEVIPPEHQIYLNTGLNKIVLKKAINIKKAGGAYQTELEKLNLENSLNTFPYQLFSIGISLFSSPKILHLFDRILNKI